MASYDLFRNLCCDSPVLQPLRQLLCTESFHAMSRIRAEGGVGVMSFHKRPQIFLCADCRQQIRLDYDLITVI